MQLLGEPTPTSNYIIDDAGVLNKTTKKAVSDRLKRLDIETGFRVEAVTVRRLEVEPDAFAFSERLLTNWCAPLLRVPPQQIARSPNYHCLSGLFPSTTALPRTGALHCCTCRPSSCRKSHVRQHCLLGTRANRQQTGTQNRAALVCSLRAAHSVCSSERACIRCYYLGVLCDLCKSKVEAKAFNQRARKVKSQPFLMQPL
jgi:hypothetical protein